MEWDDADASHQDRHQVRHEEGHYRRVEVITGRRKRRNWTPAEKARIVAESAEPGANISAVARRWGINRGLLSVWRRHVGLVQAEAARRQTRWDSHPDCRAIFDLWMTRTHPTVPFERYADDVICHCRTQSEAEALRAALAERFVACGLALHPQKTKIVYCADTNRRERYPTVQFDFLGYSFRPRFTAWPNGTYGASFLPAASPGALKAMRQEVRQWGLQNRTDTALDDLARRINPYVRGWINYYSHFYKSALYDSLRWIDFHLRKWARRKFKRFKQKPKGAARVARPYHQGQARALRALAASTCATAGYREPCELRGSRTVLGERGSEIPPCHSTGGFDQDYPPCSDNPFVFSKIIVQRRTLHSAPRRNRQIRRQREKKL